MPPNTFLFLIDPRLSILLSLDRPDRRQTHIGQALIGNFMCYKNTDSIIICFKTKCCAKMEIIRRQILFQLLVPCSLPTNQPTNLTIPHFSSFFYNSRCFYPLDNNLFISNENKSRQQQ